MTICELVSSKLRFEYRNLTSYPHGALLITETNIIDSSLPLADEYKGHSLLDACAFGDIPRVKKFLSTETVNFPDFYTEDTPLHVVARSTSPKRLQVLELLLKKSPEMNVANKNGEVPLHLATEMQHHDIMEFLLKNGASVNIEGPFSESALHVAARNADVQACRILYSHSADMSLEANGYTAAEMAPESVRSFFQEPASPDLELELLEGSKSGDILTVRRIVTPHPHLVNCRDLDGRHSTPLHFAAGYNRVPVVEFLLKYGADVHVSDKGYVSKGLICLARSNYR